MLYEIKDVSEGFDGLLIEGILSFNGLIEINGLIDSNYVDDIISVKPKTLFISKESVIDKNTNDNKPMTECYALFKNKLGITIRKYDASMVLSIVDVLENKIYPDINIDISTDVEISKFIYYAESMLKDDYDIDKIYHNMRLSYT